MKKEHQKVYNEKVKSMEEDIQGLKAQYSRETKETALKQK